MENQNNFIIDKITNSIEDVSTGNSFNTDVLPVTKKEISSVLKKNGWFFNWRQEYGEADRKIYKLAISNNSTIQGLISIELMIGYLEMHLIECAPHNFGSKKQYYGVAGNLVAYACKLSFEYGNNGYVAFTPKTNLVGHYEDTLGATLIFKNRMTISTESAKKLVNSYYKNFIV